MSGEMTIEMKKVRFFAYHGLYAEERRTGNEFEVDLGVSFPAFAVITELDSTISYAQLFKIVKAEMQKPRDLLETLAIELAEIIHAAFPQIKKIEISISKLQAPITQLTGSVGVKYCKKY